VLRRRLLGVLWLGSAASQAASAEAASDGHWYGLYVDPEVGQFDLSEHLLKYQGCGRADRRRRAALGCGGGIAALLF
jgi:hypothetical protein